MLVVSNRASKLPQLVRFRYFDDTEAKRDIALPLTDVYSPRVESAGRMEFISKSRCRVEIIESEYP